MDISVLKSRFGIIGNSPKMENLLSIASRVSSTDLSVLITGESGVGKEFFPQIIHQLSKRKHNNYIAVNCGAIPSGTIDSELFGHEKGAFTGATENRKGYFEVANQGTIFLDEVGDLPLATQVRLLRVLESGEYIKVGSSKTLKTDVRVIAATNVDIHKKIKDGKFREDLFYRLNTVPLEVPPLRERKEDIYLLFRKFVSEFSNKYAIPPVKLDKEAIDLLENYSFPGNIRQLKNLAEQISIIEERRAIKREDFEKYLKVGGVPVISQTKNESDNQQNFYNNPDFFLKIFLELKNDIIDIKKILLNMAEKTSENVIKSRLLSEKTEDVKTKNIEVETEKPLSSLSLKEQEKDLVTKVLEKYMGKRKEAAMELGISERTLYRKIRDFEIEAFY